jgi:uncharacterized membrane protein
MNCAGDPMTNSNRIYTLRVSLVMIIVFHLVRTAAAQVTFNPLGDLSGGEFRSEALAISSNASVVVGASSSSASNLREAFRWTASGGATGLGVAGSPPASSALGVSDDGAVVIGYHELTPQAFRWTAATGRVSLGFLPGSTPVSLAYGTSSDGAVVIGVSGVGRAFRWTAAEGMTPIPGPPGEFVISSRANDVSADGAVIVGSIETSIAQQQSFRWTVADGMVRLGGSGGANAVSPDGAVIVGRNNAQAFRWTLESGMVALGDFAGGAVSSSALDVSGDGAVIVGTGESSRGTEAMFWTQSSGMVNLREFLVSHGLDLAGWTLTSAEGISADGSTIVGTGQNPAGFQEAWVATIPEPSSMVLLSAAAGTMLFYLRRARRRVLRG